MAHLDGDTEPCVGGRLLTARWVSPDAPIMGLNIDVAPAVSADATSGCHSAPADRTNPSRGSGHALVSARYFSVKDFWVASHLSAKVKLTSMSSFADGTVDSNAPVKGRVISGAWGRFAAACLAAARMSSWDC